MDYSQVLEAFLNPNNEIRKQAEAYIEGKFVPSTPNLSSILIISEHGQKTPAVNRP